ncbi:phospholipase D-like domain-containing protein [Ferroacidibacillus organovorans]|uniref:phospholipase D n=1 Tax=Ferroacidibacillus organovorans TaxID=1765683 RepID=A0A853KGJ1_9BACL|nr:phospholipase D-like domain-containing protein [Ferroacidibacillus organovorans]KYP80864.1 hypothetical protein AYJ22_01530 [Ferroacidibacillus organovorans]OAG95409.1 hypothetical protein AYW79_00410 [Ferroacidibacillus organovorans]
MIRSTPQWRAPRCKALQRRVGASVFAAVILVTGCDPIGLTSDPAVPAATVEQGMTLLWGPEIKSEALQMIQASTVFCHLTMYELGDQDILASLRKAKQRGVDVRVILDATEPHSQTIALPFLRKYHIPVSLLAISGGISHIKSLVTENSTGLHALMGGMNFGPWSWENHDASVYISHAENGFEGLFQQDDARANGWPEASVAYPLPLLYDSQIEPAVLEAISGAKRTVDVEAFALTSRSFITALETAAARGVTVRVLLDAKQGYNHRSAARLARAGISVKYYAPYQGEYLHAKIVNVDHGSVLFVGSSNFSYHGFSVNHEGDLELIQVPRMGATVASDFNTQWGRGGDVSTSAYRSSSYGNG